MNDRTWVSFAIYLLVGTSVCFGWNSLVNSISSIRSIFFPSITKFSEPLTASYHVSVVVGSMILTRIESKSLFILLIGLIGSGLSSALFIFLSWTLVSNPWASFVLSASSSLLGLLVSCALTNAFAFASSSSLNTAAVSTGMGLAGLATFATWLFLSRVVFNLDDNIDFPLSATRLKLSLVAMTAVEGLVALVSVIGILLLLSGKERSGDGMTSNHGNNNDAAVNEGHNQTSKKPPVDSGDLLSTNTSLPLDIHDKLDVMSVNNTCVEKCLESSWRFVCWSCCKSFLCLFMTLAISLYLFPNIWPLSWNETSADSDLLMGVFQTGDFMGRFLPVFLPSISSHAIVTLTVIRFVVVLMLFIAASSAMANQYIWIATYLLNIWTETLILSFLSLSNGIVATLCFMDVASISKSPLAKSKASTLGLVALLAGVAVGNTLSVFNPLSYASLGA